jgi:hypothetical protein
MKFCIVVVCTLKKVYHQVLSDQVTSDQVTSDQVTMDNCMWLAHALENLPIISYTPEEKTKNIVYSKALQKTQLK